MLPGDGGIDDESGGEFENICSFRENLLSFDVNDESFGAMRRRSRLWPGHHVCRRHLLFA
jgi:hypothetical protein